MRKTKRSDWVKGVTLIVTNQTSLFRDAELIHCRIYKAHTEDQLFEFRLVVRPDGGILVMLEGDDNSSEAREPNAERPPRSV